MLRLLNFPKITCVLSTTNIQYDAPRGKPRPKRHYVWHGIATDDMTKCVSSRQLRRRLSETVLYSNHGVRGAAASDIDDFKRNSVV
eukprot:4539515-Pleurochrysis_carterae.AAC.3